MNREFLHMQKLSGIISETEYRQKLQESFEDTDGLDPDDYDHMEDGSMMDPETGKIVWTPTKGRIEEGSTELDSERIDGILSSQRFADWYENDYQDYIEGAEDAKSVEEIQEDISRLFMIKK